MFVTVLYATQHPRQVKLGLSVPPGSPIIALREQLQADTGIPLNRMVLVEIQCTGFVRVFCDSHPMSSLTKDDNIYCIEIIATGSGCGDIKEKSTANNKDSKDIPLKGNAAPASDNSTNLTLIVANAKRLTPKDNDVQRFGTPFCIEVNRDISYTELQKKLLKEMQTILKADVFAFGTPTADMFKIRLQDPSADPDTYIEPNVSELCADKMIMNLPTSTQFLCTLLQVEHPLFTEMIDLALSVLPNDAGPTHVKLLLEWTEPDTFFCDTSDPFVEHESVSQLEVSRIYLQFQ